MRHIATDRRIKISLFKTGSVVHWPVVGAKPAVGLRPPRGRISDMSSRSRIRAAWTFANAECDWGMMATLTYRQQPQKPKDDLKRFERKFVAKFGHVALGGWIMEFQARGTVHFHLFFPADFVRRLQRDPTWETEIVFRDGVETTLVRGGFDRWIVACWRSVVQDDSREFVRFQRGGIVELMRSPDAAARYVAKEAAKRVQKELPEGVKACGRWWWVNPAIKPRSRGLGVLERWPYERVMRLIFDTADALKKEKSTERARSLQVLTSHNICAAKSRAALRRNSAKSDDLPPSEIRDPGCDRLASPGRTNELFDATVFGPPDGP